MRTIITAELRIKQMRIDFLRIIFCLPLLLGSAGIHASEPVFHIIHHETLPEDIVKWDYLSYDSGSKRLFITRGDQVDVYDTGRGKMVGNIKDTPGVHGVALAPDLDKGFTSNGHSDTVTIFELSTLKILGTLPTGKKPDAIVYDPFTHRIFAANGGSGSLTVIDAVKNEVITTIVIGGKLEFAVVDGKGHYYVDIEDQNKLAVIDTVKLALMTQYDISASCHEPAGLAIDPVTERLFVGCGNKQMVVMSGDNGKVLATAPNWQGLRCRRL
jgi:YVTN family beta-propeller protein